LPRDLQLKVFLHGSVDYIKHGVQDDAAALYSFEEASTAARDAYVLANADGATSPSRYLANLIRDEFGHEIRNLSVQPLPFKIDHLPETAAVHFGPVRNIAFIGKYSSLKGWPDFVEALKLLEQANLLAGIEQIYALAPGAPPGADAATLRTIAPFRPLHLPHAELLNFIAKHSTNTLFVIPSRGENYPFVVLEQVLIGTRFVAYDSGGAPEVIGDRGYVERFCAEPNANALAGKIADVLAMATDEHQEYVASLRHEACNRQRSINISWSGVRQWPAQVAHCNTSVPDVSIVVPVYNTRSAYVSDLIQSLRDSVLRPREVIFVDDGSDPDYAGRLVRQVRDSGLPARVVRQQNQGLASARNLGLAESRSEFTYFIDSDDLLLPGALGDSWIAMMNDSELMVVGGFGLYFTDRSRLPKTPELQRQGRFWKPLGIPEARAVSLFQNQFMAANAMVRTRALLDFGSWDDADRSMWEDWALFSRLAWSGKRFCLMPQPTFLYRNTPGSMSKTHSRYFARRRLARNLPMLNRLDATTVLSLATMNGGTESSVLPLTSYEAAAITFVRKMLGRPGVRRLAVGSYRKLQAARRGWAALRNTLRLR
jgi:GT2 family glycosyltransferase